jgi:hypothetical protein
MSNAEYYELTSLQVLFPDIWGYLKPYYIASYGVNFEEISKLNQDI